MDYIAICINYADFLKHTLPLNKRHFKRVMIITTETDIETIKVCEEQNVNYILTKRVYENGAKFNKGKALNDGLKILRPNGWTVISDADIVLNNNLKNKFLTSKLDPESIYGVRRYDCPSYEAWIQYKQDYDLSGWKIFSLRSVGMGYFQLVNVNSSVLRNLDYKWYLEKYGHAGRSDRKFFRMFKNRGFLDSPVIHLDSCTHKMGANWRGRSTPNFGDSIGG